MNGVLIIPQARQRRAFVWDGWLCDTDWLTNYTEENEKQKEWRLKMELKIVFLSDMEVYSKAVNTVYEVYLSPVKCCAKEFAPKMEEKWLLSWNLLWNDSA